MLEADFKNLLLIVIKKDGQKYFVFENEIFHYHVDSLSHIYNNKFRKFYEKKINSRDVMDYLSLFKNEIVLLNKGHSNNLSILLFLPDNLTTEQLKSLKSYENIFKKASIIVKSSFGEAIFEKDENVTYDDEKKYVKYN